MEKIIVLCATIGRCNMAVTCAKYCYAELPGQEIFVMDQSKTLIAVLTHGTQIGT
jgi:hypothetical protein